MIEQPQSFFETNSPEQHLNIIRESIDSGDIRSIEMAVQAVCNEIGAFGTHPDLEAFESICRTLLNHEDYAPVFSTCDVRGILWRGVYRKRGWGTLRAFLEHIFRKAVRDARCHDDCFRELYYLTHDFADEKTMNLLNDMLKEERITIAETLPYYSWIIINLRSPRIFKCVAKAITSLGERNVSQEESEAAATGIRYLLNATSFRLRLLNYPYEEIPTLDQRPKW